MRATAKAMVKLFIRANGERGRFFAMERTTGSVISTGFFQRYALVYQFNDVGTGQQFVDKLSGDLSCHLFPSALFRKRQTVPCGHGMQMSTLRCYVGLVFAISVAGNNVRSRQHRCR
jgi:hypothetical protein